MPKSNELHGNLNVPVTEGLRAKFKKITQKFGDAVPPRVQADMLKACRTPEVKLELLDHLIMLGMAVPDINAEIRLSSDLAQKLSLRVQYLRDRQRREAAAQQATRNPLFLAPATEAVVGKVVFA